MFAKSYSELCHFFSPWTSAQKHSQRTQISVTNQSDDTHNYFLCPYAEKISALVFKAIAYLNFPDSALLGWVLFNSHWKHVFALGTVVDCWDAQSELLKADGFLLISWLLIPPLDSLEVLFISEGIRWKHHTII